MSLGLGAERDRSAADPRRPNLLVRIPGVGEGPTLVLNGHLDTKPVGGRPRPVDIRSAPPRAPRRADLRVGGGRHEGRRGGHGVRRRRPARFRKPVERRPDPGLHSRRGGRRRVMGRSSSRRFCADADACLIGEPSGWDHDWQGLHVVSRGVSAASGCACEAPRRTRAFRIAWRRSTLPQRMAELLRGHQRRARPRATRRPPARRTPDAQRRGDRARREQLRRAAGSAEFACDLRTLAGNDRGRGRERSLERWLEKRRAARPASTWSSSSSQICRGSPPSEIAADHPLVSAVRSAAAEVLGRIAPPLTVFPGGTDAPMVRPGRHPDHPVVRARRPHLLPRPE